MGQGGRGKIVKVCGVRSAAIAAAAVEEGADWIGVVLVPASPRAADPTTVHEVRSAMAGAADLVGVLVDVDTDAASCNRAAERLRLDAVQLHGRAHPSLARDLEVPVIRGINARPGGEAFTDGWWPRVPLLVDAATDDDELPGGTGRRASTAIAAALARHRRVILAGGLDAAAVGPAVALVRPWGVDASSRLETAPGHKDVDRVRAYVRAARRALLDLQPQPHPVTG